jgi:hypothetical protein
MKWLQWLIDNAWTVVIIGGVLAQMLQAVMKKKEGEGDSAPGEQPREYEFEDPDLAERTRRIREEIQRKISQRQQGGGIDAPPEAPPLLGSDETPPPIFREVVVTAPQPTPMRASTRFDAQRQAEILEQQAALEEKLREARQMKQAAAKRTEFEEATADHAAARRSATRTSVVGDLRSPDALRRAFILREVLGPPLALRK